MSNLSFLCRHLKSRNWVADAWLEHVYLRYRGPLPSELSLPCSQCTCRHLHTGLGSFNIPHHHPWATYQERVLQHGRIVHVHVTLLNLLLIKVLGNTLVSGVGQMMQ